jgi:hypothetical protein
MQQGDTVQLAPVGRISKATTAAIKEILKDGTPDWVSHPHHYRRMAEEDMQMQREATRQVAREFDVEDADLFKDEEPRLVNIKRTTEFVNKIRSTGLTCFSVASQLENGTCGLWVLGATDTGQEPIWVATMQFPYMCEWSIGQFDQHGVFQKWKYIGWRDTVLALIRKKMLPERVAHEVFGEPTPSGTSRRYRRLLKAFREGKYKDKKQK